LPWAINLGVGIFLVGLVVDSDLLVQVGAPVMGLALLYGVYVFLTSMGKAPVESAL